MKNVSATTFVKKVSTIPSKFIDELFQFYNANTLQTDFVIILEVVSKWLNVHKYVLARTLRKSYKENIDYIITRPKLIVKKDNRANNNKIYMLTPDCFKRLALLSNSKNGEMVRTYFIEIESLFLKYREQTMEGMKNEIKRLERNQKPKSANAQKGIGYMYIIRASTDNEKDVYKIGRTKNLKARVSNHQSSHADDIEILFTYRVDHVEACETCVKAFLKQFQYRKYKEVYKVDVQTIKEFMRDCGAMGFKLIQKQRSSHLSGGYYMAFIKENEI